MRFVDIPDRYGATIAIDADKVLKITPQVFNNGGPNIYGCLIEFVGGSGSSAAQTSLSKQDLLALLAGGTS